MLLMSNWLKSARGRLTLPVQPLIRGDVSRGLLFNH